MRKLLVPSVALLAAALAAPAVAAELESGLQVGAKAGPFNVKDCTGPSKGRSLCYRCRFGARPVVSIFTRTIDDNLASLVKKIDAKVAENKDQRMAAFVVLLTDDPDADEAKLKALAKKHGIKNVPLTLFDGVAGPPRYKIAKDAEVTVMMWKRISVKANHAFAKGKLDKKGIDAVVKSTAKILN
ncbi:MAG: hypothetical protein Tsb009_25930 [Planctomycetaceae bacterium]